MTIDATTVVTTDTTDYGGGKCNQLKSGDSVSVNGLLESNGAISATSIQISKHGD